MGVGAGAGAGACMGMCMSMCMFVLGFVCSPDTCQFQEALCTPMTSAMTMPQMNTSDPEPRHIHEHVDQYIFVFLICL